MEDLTEKIKILIAEHSRDLENKYDDFMCELEHTYANPKILDVQYCPIIENEELTSISLLVRYVGGQFREYP